MQSRKFSFWKLAPTTTLLAMQDVKNSQNLFRYKFHNRQLRHWSQRQCDRTLCEKRPILFLTWGTRFQPKKVSSWCGIVVPRYRNFIPSFDGLILCKECSFLPGTDVMILKIFSQKNWRKIAFLTQIKGNFAEKVIISLVFEKNANFFSPKIGKKRRKLWS
jgi:hypothetical protein